MVEADKRGAALCVLGSISVNDVDHRAVGIGGEKPRRLLAVLVLHRNTVVSTDRIMQVMWDDDIPDTAVATLHSYISRLRRLLPPPAQLISEAPGYRLAVEAGATDVDRFEAALRHALDQLDSSPRSALDAIDRGLAEWKGDSFAEFADDWWAQPEVSRLSELRLLARDLDEGQRS